MNGRLNVMLLVNDLRIGGAERQLVELARGLDRDRFRCVVATLYPGQPFESDLREAGIEVISLGRNGKFDFGTVFRLSRVLRDEKIDVIQPFLTPATFFGLTAAMIARTPVRIVTERCGLRADPGFGNRIYRFVEDRLSAGAAAAIPNSAAGLDYLAKRGVKPGVTKVIYNGVSPDRVTAGDGEAASIRSELGIPDGAPAVGIVASLQKAKDHESFLRSAALVAEAHADAHFVVVGDGELRSELEALASNLGIGDRTHFAGNQRRVAAYIALFNVAVLSSCDHEGCSNYLLEAMGQAKPIVCTNVGGNPELVTEGVNGFIVPVRSPSKMAEAINAVLADKARAAELGDAGKRRFDAEFTLEHMVGEYEQLYTELWAGREKKTARQTPAETTS